MSVRHVAFLRGINVGKAKRIAMAELRQLVEALGYTDVRTLLNSGNLVFSAPRSSSAEAARRIEGGIQKRLGISSRVTALTAAELAEVVEGNPLVKAGRSPSRLLVAFPAGADELRALATLAKRRWAPEALSVGKRAAYLWCPEGVLASAVWAAVEHEIDDAITSRTWATTTKLAELASHAD